MFSPVHLLAGFTLAKFVPGGPIPIFLTAVLSHLLLDAIPHGDAGIGHWLHTAPNRKTKLLRLLSMAAADQLFTLALFLLLLRSPQFGYVPLPLLLVGSIGSILPDYISGIRDLLPHPPGWLEKLHRLHQRCHYRGHDPLSIRGGLIFQTLLTLTAICASYIL